MVESVENDDLSIEKVADLVKSEVLRSNNVKWDIYLLDQEINGLYLRKTVPELEVSRHNLSYVIRIFEDKPENKMGCGVVSLNCISPENIQKAIKKAKTISEINTGPKYDLISPGKKYPTLKTIDKDVWEDPKSFLKEKGIEIRQQLREIVPATTTFGKFRVYKTRKMLINSFGFSKLKKSTNFYYEFSFKSVDEKGKGRMAEYWPAGWFKTVDQLKFEKLIPEWVSMARDTLKAKFPPSNKSIDIIFPPRLVRIALLETIGYSATGPSLFEKTSHLRSGEQIASENLTILDGLEENLLGSSEWDSEGYPKQTTTIIENGIMKNFLFDQKFAKLLNEKSTGNAQRKPSRGGDIQVEINNLIVKPGSISLKEIVENSKHAMYINKFSWLHPNPITGKFGASIDNAYMIENGKLTQPIKGGIVSGNVYKMIKNISGISKETRIVMNSKVPFIKFKNLKVN